MITGAAPGRSSSGMKARPCKKETPRIEKSLEDISRPETYSDSPDTLTVPPLKRHAAISRERFSLLQSRKLGYANAHRFPYSVDFSVCSCRKTSLSGSG